MIASLGERQPAFEGTDHFVAHNATVIGSVRIGQGVSIWFNAVIRGDNDWIEIGENSNIQDGSILHTDAGIRLQIGRNVTVGHRVMLHGCRIGDGSLIGIGSTILNNARIGNDCLVGAHSLVTEGREFPDRVLILDHQYHFFLGHRSLDPKGRTVAASFPTRRTTLSYAILS